MGHCETLSVSRIRNSIFRILLSQLPLEGSKWFRHSCPTSSKKSCQQRTVYFHSLSGLLKPFLPRWLMSHHPLAHKQQRTALQLVIFLKTTGSLLLKTIRSHWPSPTGKPTVWKLFCFPQIIALGPRSGDVAFPVHQSAFQENHITFWCCWLSTSPPSTWHS